VFAVVELIVTACELALLHTVWFGIENETAGAGFTVIEYVAVVPLQPFAVGVTV